MCASAYLPCAQVGEGPQLTAIAELLEETIQRESRKMTVWEARERIFLADSNGLITRSRRGLGRSVAWHGMAWNGWDSCCAGQLGSQSAEGSSGWLAVAPSDCLAVRAWAWALLQGRAHGSRMGQLHAAMP